MSARFSARSRLQPPALGETPQRPIMATGAAASPLLAALHPLHIQHLGVLARCYAVSPAVVRAHDAASLLQHTFGLKVEESVVASVLLRLEAQHPELLGGEPLAYLGFLPDATVILPAVDVCYKCDQALKLGKPRHALAFFLNFGWRPVRYIVGKCSSCPATFSGTWMTHAQTRGLCASVTSPEECQFTQIVASPRCNAASSRRSLLRPGATPKRSLKLEFSGCSVHLWSGARAASALCSNVGRPPCH